MICLDAGSTGLAAILEMVATGHFSTTAKWAMSMLQHTEINGWA